MILAFISVLMVLLCSIVHASTVISGSLVMSFSDDNGAILSVIDKTTGMTLSSGSQKGCLWGFTDLNSQYAGGCEFSASAGTFKSATTPSGGLQMTFDGAQAPLSLGTIAVSVEPTVASGGSGSSIDAIDMSLTIMAPPATSSPSRPFTQLLWPSELLFDGNRTSAVVLPLMPGLWLGQGAFGWPEVASPTISIGYPGRGVFADVAWVRMNASASVQDPNSPTDPDGIDAAACPSTSGLAALGMTTVTEDLSSPQQPNPAARVIPATLTVKPAATADGQWVLSHGFDINVTSATTGGKDVRFTTRLIANPSLLQAGAASVEASGLGAPGAAAGLTQRLGGAEKAAWMMAAPLMKVDTGLMGNTFADWDTEMLPFLPSPSLVHVAGMEPEGFDHYYPDMLPPNPAYGTTLDLQHTVQVSHDLGHVFMPYTNPTWWDVHSPTVAKEMPAAGLILQDITALNTSLQPEVQCYGPNCGVAVCPASLFVAQRVADLMLQIVTTNVSKHGPGIGSDAAFCDQIGARPPFPDENPLSRQLALRAFGAWGEAVGGSAGFARGWQQFLWDQAMAHVHSEQGFDKLLAAGPGGEPGVGGFHGQQLLQMFSSMQTGNFCIGGKGNTPGRDPDSGACFRAVPLVQSMFKPLVPLHQHDLANLQFDFSPIRISWDAAMSLQLALLVHSSPCADYSTRCPWAFGVALVQRELLAPVANQPVTSFRVQPRGETEIWHSSMQPTHPNAATDPWQAATVITVANRDASAPLAWTAPAPHGLAVSTLSATVAAPGFVIASNSSSSALHWGNSSVPWLSPSIGSIGGLFSGSVMGVALPTGTMHLIVQQYSVNISASGWRVDDALGSALAVLVWHPVGPSTAIAAPALASWPSTAHVSVAPFARNVSHRSVSLSQCGPAINVTGVAGTVAFPSASFACSAGQPAAFAAAWV